MIKIDVILPIFVYQGKNLLKESIVKKIITHYNAIEKRLREFNGILTLTFIGSEGNIQNFVKKYCKIDYVYEEFYQKPELVPGYNEEFLNMLSEKYSFGLRLQ